jgi:hypothetical protein
MCVYIIDGVKEIAITCPKKASKHSREPQNPRPRV